MVLDYFTIAFDDRFGRVTSFSGNIVCKNVYDILMVDEPACCTLEPFFAAALFGKLVFAKSVDNLLRGVSELVVLLVADDLDAYKVFIQKSKLLFPCTFGSIIVICSAIIEDRCASGPVKYVIAGIFYSLCFAEEEPSNSCPIILEFLCPVFFYDFLVERIAPEIKFQSPYVLTIYLAALVPGYPAEGPWCHGLLQDAV